MAFVAGLLLVGDDFPATPRSFIWTVPGGPPIRCRRSRSWDAVACVSDSGGEAGLDVIPADGSGARRIGHGEFGRILGLAVAPDGRTAAVACADGRLLTVALDGEPVITQIARSTIEEVAGLAFSPDSALLAWSQPWLPEPRASQIRLARLADGAVTDVTPPRFDDTSPAFTLDGKYLAFLSNRAFDPVYDAHHLDLGFLPGVRPYLVTLLAVTPSPFAPDLSGHPVEPESPAAVPGAVGLDVAGLAERIEPFPVAAGRYDKLRAARDGVVWLELPQAGELGEAAIGAAQEYPQSRLLRYDLAQRRRSVEVEGLDDYAMSADGTRLAYRIGESLEIKPTGLPAQEAVSVDLDGVLGEMGTSHTGIMPFGGAGDPAQAQGLLGADVEPAGDGTWRIARILPGESSVTGARSPLAAPASRRRRAISSSRSAASRWTRTSARTRCWPATQASRSS